MLSFNMNANVTHLCKGNPKTLFAKQVCCPWPAPKWNNPTGLKHCHISRHLYYKNGHVSISSQIAHHACKSRRAQRDSQEKPKALAKPKPVPVGDWWQGSKTLQVPCQIRLTRCTLPSTSQKEIMAGRVQCNRCPNIHHWCRSMFQSL